MCLREIYVQSKAGNGGKMSENLWNKWKKSAWESVWAGLNLSAVLEPKVQSGEVWVAPRASPAHKYELSPLSQKSKIPIIDSKFWSWKNWQMIFWELWESWVHESASISKQPVGWVVGGAADGSFGDACSPLLLLRPKVKTYTWAHFHPFLFSLSLFIGWFSCCIVPKSKPTPEYSFFRNTTLSSLLKSRKLAKIISVFNTEAKKMSMEMVSRAEQA